jgi:hypothetical protein
LRCLLAVPAEREDVFARAEIRWHLHLVDHMPHEDAASMMPAITVMVPEPA